MEPFRNHPYHCLCLIINGLVQGVLSLNNRWQNKKRLLICYAILAVAVVAFTQPVWELVKLIIPGYPFGLTEAGNALFTPVLGQDQWRRILTAPIFSALAAPMEPIFPCLAISFIGVSLVSLFVIPQK